VTLSRAGAAKPADLKIDSSLAHPEAYSIRAAGNATTVTGGGPGGVLYGVREWISRPPSAALPVTERPDFCLRGTVLFLMKEANCDYQLTLTLVNAGSGCRA
jgi:hypothetical protein